MILKLIRYNNYIKYIDFHDQQHEDYSNKKYVLKNNKITGSATKCKLTYVKKHDEPSETTLHRKIKKSKLNYPKYFKQ